MPTAADSIGTGHVCKCGDTAGWHPLPQVAYSDCICLQADMVLKASKQASVRPLFSAELTRSHKPWGVFPFSMVPSPLVPAARHVWGS